MSWNKENTKKLIELWECHDALWNQRSKEYQSRNKRESALNEIGAVLGKTQNEVKTKLHALRSQMSGERIILVFCIFYLCNSKLNS